MASICPYLDTKIFKRWTCGLLALCLVYLYVWQRKRKVLEIIPHVGPLISETADRILEIIGKYSLEVYLVHACILQAIDVYNVWDFLPWYIWWLLMVVATCMFIWVIVKVRKVLSGAMKGNFRRQA
ncbi:MAG: hypothetical protein NC126_05070 [Clostridium sp.]|nr:hypothetical protein [Clostridium sp.]